MNKILTLKIVCAIFYHLLEIQLKWSLAISMHCSTTGMFSVQAFRLI